jgi:hypothetical protein
VNYVLSLAAVMLLFGCQEEDKPRRDELPAAVSETRSSILEAAQAGDYEALRPIIKLDRFLSDYGFGGSQPDPVARWRRLGSKPLETMEVLLQMRHQVRETNEGTLYQWPRFDANSKPEDITEDERRQLRQVLTEAEFREATVREYGYTGPWLGILADGTWWFFNLRREP